jgi:hypothetical protein
MKDRLFAVCVLCFVFTGCAAGKVYVDQTADNHATCSVLQNELEGTQVKIKKIEDTEHPVRTLRDLVLGAAGFAFPPLGILNAILTVSDSHVADLAETSALEDRYNDMVAISNQKECGYKYAQRPTSRGGN